MYTHNHRYVQSIHIPVRGHRALTAIPSGLSSSDIPRTHMDIPYLAIV